MRPKGYKVPFRMIYCETIGQWVRETVWCHIVLKIWPNATSTKA